MSVCFRRTDAGWHEHVMVPVPDVLQGRTFKQEVLQILNRPCMHTPICIWPSAYCAHALYTRYCAPLRCSRGWECGAG
jgi:hypothetical protein